MRELELASVGQGCLGKADDDEPVFILRAQDKLAPILVSLWVDLAAAHGAPADKVREAARLIGLMTNWQERTGRAKWPD
jgi:hypothetical protein